MKKSKLVLFVLALAVVAAAVLYYAAVAPALVGGERVAGVFAGALRDGPGLDVRYADATFKLFPRPALELRDVTFIGRGGKEIIRADALRIGLSYVGFITLKPSVATVEFVRPRADLAPGDVSLGEAGKAPSFRGTVTITDGFVRYAGETRTALMDGVSGRLRCKAAWGEELEVRGKLNADKLRFAAAAGEAAGGMAVAAEGKLRYRPEAPGGRLFFDELDFLFGKARLSVGGELQTGAGEKEVELALTGKRMALGQVLPALAPRFGDAELEGELDLSLGVKGRWGEGRRPDVRGKLEVKKGALRPAEGEGISGVAASVRFAGDKYVVENVRGRTRGGSFKGHGVVRPADNWPYKLKLEGPVPLEVVATALGIPDAYMLAGAAQLDLDVDGELSNPGRTSLEGTIRLSDCRARLKPFAVPFQRLSGTLYCDGYRIKTGKVKGQLGGDEFEIGGSWQGFDTPRVDFVAVADELDLDAALPTAEVKRRFAERGSAPLGLPGRDITAKGRVRFKKFKLLSVRGSKLEADFEYGGGILNIKKLDFNAYDGKVRAQMTVYPGAHPRYTCSATIRGARVGVFLTENKYLENVVTGRFSADATFSAEGTAYDDVARTFGGKGSLELAGGRVAGLPLVDELAKWSRIDLFSPLQVSKLWAMCDARDGVVRTAELRVENPDMVVEAAGEATLGKKVNFAVRTKFNEKAAERLARAGKALALVRDEEGGGHFNFVVTGEAARPAFQLDAASMLGAAGEEAPRGEEEELVGTGDLF
ncbi:MAG: hypothetical protein GTN49_03355 [candidate division Zixibacteria bacterium]|nr:hypothetical protein [candidate division Zixibacteria bacterium]